MTAVLADTMTWKRRPPTVEECLLVGRDTGYAEDWWAAAAQLGDYVIETPSDGEAQRALAVALERFGCCDAAHAIPAGVYLEE